MRHIPLITILSAVVVVACTSSQTLPDGSTGNPNSPGGTTPAGHLTLQPSGSEMLQAESMQLTALVRTDADTVLQGAVILWASSRPEVAAVDKSGRVTAIAPGDVTILVGYDSQVLTRHLTVFSNAPLSVVVNSQQSSLNVGASLPLPVVVRGMHDLLITSPTVTWSSDHPEVATVSATGVVKGIAPGTATINVASGAVLTPYQIRVRSVTPLSIQLIGGTTDTLLLSATTVLSASVIATDSLLLTTPVSWAAFGSAVTVSSSGVVTAMAAGSATIVATAGGAMAQRTFVVHNFSRYATAVGIGTMEDLAVDETEAVPTFSQAAGSSGFVEWPSITTSNTAVAKILPGGTILATGPGTVTITARARFAPPATRTIHVYPHTAVAAAPAVQSVQVTTGSAGAGWTWYQPNIVMQETSGAAGYRVRVVWLTFVGASDNANAYTFYRVNPGATRTLWDDLSYYDDPFGVTIPSTSHPTAMTIRIDYTDDAGNQGTVTTTVNLPQGG